MSKINNNGLLSGHVGNLVHREVRGKQVIQAMPSHYRDANTAAQQVQRSGMRNIMAFYRLLKEAIKEQFEDTTPLRRAYNCFMHHNLFLPAVVLEKKDFEQGLAMPAPYVVSHGTLPPLETKFVDDCLQIQMKAADWKSGDILRYIQAIPSQDNRNSPSYWKTVVKDEVIEYPEDKLIQIKGLSHGAYTYIHIRNSKEGKLVSSQQLVLL